MDIFLGRTATTLGFDDGSGREWYKPNAEPLVIPLLIDSKELGPLISSLAFRLMKVWDEATTDEYKKQYISAFERDSSTFTFEQGFVQDYTLFFIHIIDQSVNTSISFHHHQLQNGNTPLPLPSLPTKLTPPPF